MPESVPAAPAAPAGTSGAGQPSAGTPSAVDTAHELSRDGARQAPSVGAAPKSGVRLLTRAIWRSRRRLLLGYPLIITWQLGEALVPVVIGVIIDRGIATADVRAFVAWMVALAVLFAVLSVSYRFGGRQSIRAIQEEEHRLRMEISSHVLHPLGARTTMLPGEILSLATSDAQLVSVVVRQIGFTVAALSSLVVVAVYLFGVDLLLGLVILLGLPTVVAITQLVSPLVSRRSVEQQSAIARASGVATDLVRGLRPLKGIGGEDVASAGYRRASRDARDATIRMSRSWGYLAGLTSTLSGLFLAVVTVVAGTRAAAGDITLGQLIAVVGLTQFLAEPISALGELSAQAAASLASARRIVGFLSSPRARVAGTRSITEVVPAVALRAVTAGGLRDLTITVPPGGFTAVVADDPSDAATIMALLGGESVPVTGTVDLGDVPLDEADIGDRRRVMVVNPHHTEIFEGTLRSIVDPEGRLPEPELDRILSASAADELVSLHRDGLEHRVMAAGASLSGGQRQRLALARALAIRTPVLVLHDPTSAVDAVTEDAIAQGLREVRAGLTTLVLTTSPAILARADEVVHVRSPGDVVTSTHAALLADRHYQQAVLR